MALAPTVAKMRASGRTTKDLRESFDGMFRSLPEDHQAMSHGKSRTVAAPLTAALPLLTLFQSETRMNEAAPSPSVASPSSARPCPASRQPARPFKSWWLKVRFCHLQRVVGLLQRAYDQWFQIADEPLVCAVHSTQAEKPRLRQTKTLSGRAGFFSRMEPLPLQRI
jgi:hypothetical protein